ncbi:MAG: phosphatidylinositol kinase [Ignavibacteria bacterium CHB3]|nr:phosphatidylinositol kinase [Ignavibacteria bacterium CHB3]
MRRGKVFYKDEFAGIVIEDDNGVSFRDEPYTDKVMLPFFDNLIPEGWLLEIAEQNWKINPRDRMGLLLAFCKDTIGAVSVIREESNE